MSHSLLQRPCPSVFQLAGKGSNSSVSIQSIGRSVRASRRRSLRAWRTSFMPPKLLEIVQALPSSGIQNDEALDEGCLVISSFPFLDLNVSPDARGHAE